MSPHNPFGPPTPGPRPLAGSPLGPPAQASAAHQALLAATLARAVRNSERYLRALRVAEASTQAARQHARAATRLDGVRASQADTLAFTNHRRYAARLATQPYATIGPGLTPQERLWQHVVATMPYEFALMTRLDPVTRSVGGAVAVVGTVLAAPLAYVATEDLALAGLENSAALLENNGAALVAHLRAVTLGSFIVKGGINAVGQGVGNYIVKRDALAAVENINAFSVIASGLSVPLEPVMHLQAF